MPSYIIYFEAVIYRCLSSHSVRLRTSSQASWIVGLPWVSMSSKLSARLLTQDVTPLDFLANFILGWGLIHWIYPLLEYLNGENWHWNLSGIEVFHHVLWKLHNMGYSYWVTGLLEKDRHMTSSALWKETLIYQQSTCTLPMPRYLWYQGGSSSHWHCSFSNIICKINLLRISHK